MNPERAIDVVDVPREIKDRMNDLRGEILDAVIKILLIIMSCPNHILLYTGFSRFAE
jgi:hypothetical protein